MAPRKPRPYAALLNPLARLGQVVLKLVLNNCAAELSAWVVPAT